MNRKQRRRASKLGQIPGNPAANTGTVVVPPGHANLLGVGLKHHQAGRLAEAEAYYRRVLAAQPDHADALHLLGIVANQARRHDLAVQLISQAIKQNGERPDYFCSLGIALKNQGKLDEAVAAYRQAIRINPDLPEAHCNLGNALHDQDKLTESLASYDRALAVRPDYAEALYSRGVILQKLKRFEEALASYDRALTVRPDYAGALSNRGVILQKLKRFDEALASYDRALTVRPDYAEALSNRGNTLHELKRFEEALASCDRALAVRPNFAEALYNRGNTLHELKRFEEALASCDRALAVRPNFAEALYNRGNTLHELRRFEEALASYDRALAMRPDFAEALSNRGNTLHELKRFEEALASYDRALAVRPDYAEALSNRGNTLHELKRFEEALASYDRALAVRPDYTEALSNRGNTLHELKRFEEALASCDRALAVRPNFAEALYNRSVILQKLKRFEEALASYDRLLAAKADHPHAFSGVAHCVMRLCDFDRRTRFATDLCAHVSGKKSIVSPFVLLGYSGDPALQVQCARNHIENMIPSPLPPLCSGQKWRHDKLRVAYLSPDFRSHPTAVQTAELFELHDRSRFEIIGVSFGVDDRSEMRKRLVAAFDEFHDVRKNSDKEVAKLLNDRHFDIAVDLAGYTQDSRPTILAHRPVPIQVNYLGFPATMGADFIDYIIADAMVLPVEHQPYYTEKVVYLPDCYQVNDTKRKIAERTPTRQEIGLPEHAFVLCCFNNNWKITPEIFDIWMRLLQQVEGSVLWLLGDNEGAERRLRKETQRRGIDPSRLVFAGRLPPAEHLARHRLADLFLDTLPYNSHTTASDALWAGLPVLTCKGEAFAGRVAASLLHAVGIPELITSNLEDYQTLALKLVRDAALLAEIKAKLARNRNTYPLFNTERFACHIEAAYRTMWETWQRGEVPKSFSVEPIDLRRSVGVALASPAWRNAISS
jgi:predicted O-linked N-acetylglucosamine transferase (SPINDLY family)